VFVIDGADGVGVGFGDHEHYRSIGTRAVDGKRGVNGTSSWGGEVNSYLVALCISPVAAARWTSRNDRIAGHRSSLLTKGAICQKCRVPPPAKSGYAARPAQHVERRIVKSLGKCLKCCRV